MPSFDHKVPPVAENTKALLLPPKCTHTHTHPCRLKNCSYPVPLQQHLSIQALLIADIPNNVFNPPHVPVWACVCVWDGSECLTFCKMTLFPLSFPSTLNNDGFSHNLTGKWHHLLLTPMMSRIIPQSIYCVATVFLCTVSKFITPQRFHRITVVEMAFTSTEFMSSFRSRLGHVAACSSAVSAKGLPQSWK